MLSAQFDHAVYYSKVHLGAVIAPSECAHLGADVPRDLPMHHVLILSQQTTRKMVFRAAGKIKGDFPRVLDRLRRNPRMSQKLCGVLR